MGALPPPIPPSVIRALRENRFQGLDISVQDEIYKIVEIMTTLAGGVKLDWIGRTKHKDPDIDWCLKQIDRLLLTNVHNT